ncbi:hypothetical protein HWV62_29312 [Athelia sp. TMB]|nr:hypothetical protein HWV62_29312 [Athelia sp. TMB]
MDKQLLSFYDSNGAGALLQSMADNRASGKQFHRQLSSYAKVTAQRISVRRYRLIRKKASGPEMYCTQPDDIKGIRLGAKVATDGHIEEAVLRVQGVICKTHLPPKRKLLRGEPDTVRFMQQSFTLTGLGSTQFETAIEGAFAVAEFLSRQDSEMAMWRPSHVNGQLALEIGNRLFIKQNKTGSHFPAAMDSSVDPYGTLQKAANGEYVHTEDCVVRYFRRDENEDGSISYNKAESGSFKPGDIVEAQCSFIVIPTRKGDHTMKIILRALTMLDCEFSKAARLSMWKSIATASPATPSVEIKTSLRRTVGYEADAEFEDEVAYMNKKVKTMQVDSN